MTSLLEHELKQASQTVADLAAEAAQSPDTSPLNAVLSEQARCDAFPCFTGLALLAADGTVRRSAGLAVDVERSALEGAPAVAGDAAGGRPVRFVLSSQRPPSLVLLAPVPREDGSAPDRGRLLAAQLSLAPFFTAHLRAPRADSPDYHGLVLAADGTIVFQSSHPERGVANVRARTDRCFTCHDSLDHVEHMLVGGRSTLRYRLQNVDQLAAVAPLAVGGERWVVGVRAPRSAAVAPLSADLRRIGALAIALAAVAAGGGALAWRRERRRKAADLRWRYQTRLLEETATDLKTRFVMIERAAHEWRMAADTIDAAFIVLEPNGTIVRMNVAAAGTLPDGLGAWLGRPSAQLAEHSPWDKAFRLVAGAVEHQVVTTERVRSGGRTWDLWCRVLPEREPTTVLLMARDVTGVVDLQESLRRSETMAQLGSIVSGVAHEVRNPLFAISSLVDAWAVQSHRDPQPFVDALRGEVNRLRTLMVDLLEYGRPAKTTRQMQRLGQVVDGAIQACTHEATARDVRVIASPFPDVEIVMDSRRLERVFINLVQNAIQHSSACSEVRVDALLPPADPGHIVITVRDSGPGFSAEDLPRVFTPFFSRRPGGFGLGLAITERIVTEHGGRVAAANAPAGGAVMTVWLPVARARSAGPTRQVQRV